MAIVLPFRIPSSSSTEAVRIAQDALGGRDPRKLRAAESALTAALPGARRSDFLRLADLLGTVALRRQLYIAPAPVVACIVPIHTPRRRGTKGTK